MDAEILRGVVVGYRSDELERNGRGRRGVRANQIFQISFVLNRLTIQLSHGVVFDVLEVSAHRVKLIREDNRASVCKANCCGEEEPGDGSGGGIVFENKMRLTLPPIFLIPLREKK